MLVENCGIEYYPPSEAATKTAKSTTSKISDPEDLKTTTTRNKQKGRKMKQQERKRANFYLEEKEDGEISEPEEIGYINKENTGEHRKSQANSEPILAVDIFQKLVSELDDHLTATVNKFYEPVLKELDKLIEAPTSGIKFFNLNRQAILKNVQHLIFCQHYSFVATALIGMVCTKWLSQNTHNWLSDKPRDKLSTNFLIIWGPTTRYCYLLQPIYMLITHRFLHASRIGRIF